MPTNNPASLFLKKTITGWFNELDDLKQINSINPYFRKQAKVKNAIT